MLISAHNREEHSWEASIAPICGWRNWMPLNMNWQTGDRVACRTRISLNKSSALPQTTPTAAVTLVDQLCQVGQESTWIWTETRN